MTDLIEETPENDQIQNEFSEKMSSGLLKMYEPTFKNVQSHLNELTCKQQQLVSQVETENSRLKQMESEELKEMFATIKDHLTRLQSIKKEMILLSERSEKLKKRALKLHHVKQNEALEREQQREAQLTKEQELIAKPNKN